MIFDNPIFTDMILPFLLVFIIIFAILQRTKILGEEKHQIDAMTSLVIGLILIGVPAAREIVVGLMPWLSVGVVIILMFLIMYGSVVGDLSKDLPGWLKNGGAAFAIIFTLGIVLFVTPLGSWFWNWASVDSNSDVWVSIVMLLVIVGVVVVAVKGQDWGNKSS